MNSQDTEDGKGQIRPSDPSQLLGNLGNFFVHDDGMTGSLSRNIQTRPKSQPPYKSMQLPPLKNSPRQSYTSAFDNLPNGDMATSYGASLMPKSSCKSKQIEIADDVNDQHYPPSKNVQVVGRKQLHSRYGRDVISAPRDCCRGG
jgi:hypothetical protein